MIVRLWIKLIGLVLICLLPLLVVFFVLHAEILKFGFLQQNQLAEVLEQYQRDLKMLSTYDSKNESKYKEQFYKNQEVKMTLAEANSIGFEIQNSFFHQTIFFVSGVIGVSLLLSWFFAGHVVKQFKTLLNQNEQALQMVNSLRSIESWQNIARMLVHELRTPLTPIKMVLSSLKEGARKPVAILNSRVEEGADIGLEQIGYIENMLRTFSEFAKLPAPVNQEIMASSFFAEFAELVDHIFGFQVRLYVDMASVERIPGDPQLLTNLFFNLVKNANEANAEKPVEVIIKVFYESDAVVCEVSNRGKLIPDELKDKIFDLSVSSKRGQAGSNLGVGLTICRKIAMDHGGLLDLLYNDSERGVVFALRLPLNKEDKT